jgi:hypothetical protein
MVRKKPTRRAKKESTRPRQTVADLASRLARMERIVSEDARRLRVQFQRLAQLQADIDMLKERIGASVKPSTNTE